MKTISTGILALSIAALSLSSCVSNKKYEEALSWKNKYNKLENQYSETVNQKNEQISEKEIALSQKEAELTAKEQELVLREQKVEELNDLILAQKNAVLALKQEVCSALKCFTPEELQVNLRDGRLYVSLSDQLLFPSGSDKINKRGKEAVKMLSEVLANSELKIMIEGHTDNVPISTHKYQDNWDLSVHRATSIVREMIASNIDPKRIIAAGQGEHKPVASNKTQEGKQQNRRTEIVLEPKLDQLWKLTEDENIISDLK